MIKEDIVWSFLAGELSPQEEIEVVKWCNESSSNQKCFDELKAIWMATFKVEDKTTKDDDINFKEILSKIRAKPTDRIKKRKLVHKHLLRVAAAIILLYSLSLSYFSLFQNRDEQYIEVITKRGKQSEIFLPDGTHIWLNSESSLKYPNKISGKKVDIFLEGEAYFNVAKLKGRDFTVNAGEIEITVQGTSFNVKAYNNDNRIETTLDEGKITVTNWNNKKQELKPITMKPNQHLVINPAENIYKIYNLTCKKVQTNTQKPLITGNIETHNGAAIFTAWKDGVLVFKNKRFEDLEKELERWYDVQIVMEDPLLKEARYTGVFEKESLQTALKALSLSLPFKYTLTPDSVIITPDEKIKITKKTNMPMN